MPTTFSPFGKSKDSGFTGRCWGRSQYSAIWRGNVIGFIPFGMILPVIWPKTGKVLRILLLSFEFSLCVETIQLVWKVGSFDVDDLILNTLGGVIGYMLFWICNKIRRKIYG